MRARLERRQFLMTLMSLMSVAQDDQNVRRNRI